ncbi:hypothetical protein GQR58_015142 [Nymphon striatum]|nr:hypothetical protein GQR58_015142 [Nymphon striatum]
MGLWHVGGRVNPTENAVLLCQKCSHSGRNFYFSHCSQELAYLAGAPVHRDYPNLYSNSEVCSLTYACASIHQDLLPYSCSNSKLCSLTCIGCDSFLHEITINILSKGWDVFSPKPACIWYQRGKDEHTQS